MRRLWSHIPLFGELVNVKRQTLRVAAYEILVSTIFTTFPLWLFPLLAFLIISDAPPFEDGVYKSIEQGELFIYASALVGPLIFSIMKNYASWSEDNKSESASKIGRLTLEFPYGAWFVSIALFVCFIAALCFTFFRYSNLGLITVTLNRDSLVWWSFGLYMFSLLCLYAVVVYRNALENISPKDIAGTDEFLEAWRNRK